MLTLHTSITTLPLSRFIDVVVDGNYTALVISGMPTPEDQLALLHACQKINEQYIDAVGDGEQQVYLQALKEVAILKSKINMVNSMTEVLSKIHGLVVESSKQAEVDAYKTDFEKRLNEILSANILFNRNDPTEYLRQLRGCQNRAKAFKIDLDLKELHIRALEEKRNDKGDKQAYTREYFQSILISISDYAKYQIGEEITVFQFCERVRRYNQYVEQMGKQVK